MEEENYDKIISECTKEIDSAGRYMGESLLLRATFYLLIGNATAAQPDLDRVINMPHANVKVETILWADWSWLLHHIYNLKSPPHVFMCILQLRANALIKRGSMYMQQQQPMLSTQDFNMAAEIDPGNPDVFHHRGQVLTQLVSRCCFDLIRERALVTCSVFFVYSSNLCSWKFCWIRWTRPLETLMNAFGWGPTLR